MKVEVTKAVVSVKAVMVDGKSMTLAMFKQIPMGMWPIEEEGACGPDPVCLGIIQGVKRDCPDCFYQHDEWALCFDGTDLALIPVRCNAWTSCASHSRKAAPSCPDCKRIAASLDQGKKRVLAKSGREHVYIAVGGSR